MGWPRCRVTGRHTWRKGRGAAAPCTSGAGTGSTRRRWRGSTAGSGCWATTDAVPAGTTPRSPTGRSGASASPSTGNPVCTRHRCSSTRWARPCGCRTCRVLPTCRTRWRGSPASPNSLDAPCRQGESCPPSSKRVRSPWLAGDPSRRRRSTACSPHSTRRCRRSARRVRAPTPPASTPSSSTGSPAPSSTNTAGRPTSAVNAHRRSRYFEQHSAHSPSRTMWCAAAPSSSTLHCVSCVTNSIGTDVESAANPSSSPACVS